MFKAIGGAIIVFGWMYIHWTGMGRSPRSIGVAARRGLSPFRIARPYNRWGVDARCDIWTLCGVLVGAALGLGFGWMLGSLPLGILLAGIGAPIAGWRYRVAASLLAVERNAHEALEAPPRAEPPGAPGEPSQSGRGARDSRLKLALAGVVCGVVVALVALSRSDTQGPIAVVGFIAIVLFVAWRVIRITDSHRAA